MFIWKVLNKKMHYPIFTAESTVKYDSTTFLIYIGPWSYLNSAYR